MLNKVQIRGGGNGRREGGETPVCMQSILKKNLISKKFPASFPPFPPQTHNLLLLSNCCYMYVYVYTRVHIYM